MLVARRPHTKVSIRSVWKRSHPDHLVRRGATRRSGHCCKPPAAAKIGQQCVTRDDKTMCMLRRKHVGS
eukprot:45514-Chlamydomonas_euryale.AAC.1